MEENTDRIAQLLLSGGDSEKSAIESKVDKIASLFEGEAQNAQEKAKLLLEGGFEENFINYDEKLKQCLESEEEQKKYQELGCKLLGEEGKKQREEAKQQCQISQLQLLGAAPNQNPIDDELQKIVQELQYGGKIATKEELKQIHPDKTPKLMNQYQEYHESSSQKDAHGLPVIRKVNNYDLGKYLQTISSLTMSGKKYQDPDFPPAKATLLGDGSNKDGLKWLTGPNAVTIFRRCSEIFGEGKFQLFKGGIEPQDMNQGNIGNCYFMGSIAALAETPSRISKLFVNKDANPSGCYALNLCEQGLLREIIIDDYIPCYKSNGTPAFAHNNGNEIWAMLIEKVWAKMYGGYANIIGGLGREVFNEMTGAPCQTLPTKNHQTFDEIYKGEQLNWPMCCASNQGSGSHDNKTSGGIANCHLYTMLGGYKVKYQGKDVELVRLRNPWGKCEWRGAFGDEWPGWNDPSLKAQVPYEKKDDGIFYMTYQDFQKEFSHVDICMYFDNYKFTTLECSSNFLEPKFYEITIATSGSYFFMAVQQSNRKFSKQDRYQYSRMSLTLALDKDNMIYPIKFAQDPASYPNIDSWIYCQKLDAGKYILGTRCAWFDKKPHKLTLKSYGQDFIEFKCVDAHRYKNLKF